MQARQATSTIPFAILLELRGHARWAAQVSVCLGVNVGEGGTIFVALSLPSCSSPSGSMRLRLVLSFPPTLLIVGGRLHTHHSDANASAHACTPCSAHTLCTCICTHTMQMHMHLHTHHADVNASAHACTPYSVHTLCRCTCIFTPTMRMHMHLHTHHASAHTSGYTMQMHIHLRTHHAVAYASAHTL